MPRPHKKRSVNCPPVCTSFKPVGVRGRDLPSISLTLDELEAIRLADYESLDHAPAAEQMDISRSTFSRLVERARQKVARFLIDGQLLQIEGGEIHFQDNVFRCRECGQRHQTTLKTNLTACPNCGSTDLIDMAQGHGHGRCCHRHHQGRRPFSNGQKPGDES